MTVPAGRGHDIPYGTGKDDHYSLDDESFPDKLNFGSVGPGMGARYHGNLSWGDKGVIYSPQTECQW